ncbi:hypothetical protein WS7_21519, partial [Xanthomonas citri pv. malvacearum str. GSPB2388]
GVEPAHSPENDGDLLAEAEVAHEVINAISITSAATGKRGLDRSCSAIGHSLDMVCDSYVRKIATRP